MIKLSTILLAIAFIIIRMSVTFAQEITTPEPSTISSVEFTGNTVVSTDELREVVGIQPGDNVTPASLSEAIRRIEQAYTERGYIAAFVFYEIQGEQPSRTLVFNIREAKVSEIRVTGLERTREETVRRVIETKPGDVYSQRAVQRDVARLDELGLFDEIKVLLERGRESDQVIVIFSLKEAKTRRVDLGGSYSPEGSLIGQVQYSDRNLFGRAQQLIASVNVGSIEGRIGGQVSYFNPFAGPQPGTTFLARAFSDVTFRFSRDLVEEPSTGRYFERHTGLQTSFTRPAGRAQQISYGFRYENVNVENFPQEFLTNDFGTSGGQLLIPSAFYTQDRRLYLVLPASGSYTSAFLEAGYSSPDVGGSGIIPKLQGQRRWYIPIQRITEEMLASENPMPTRTVAVRLRAGTSTGDLPFYEQYFIGGVTDLRGYRESRFWGKNYVTLNTELRWPLSREFVGLAFVDAGDAWGSDFLFTGDIETDFQQHENFSPRLGAGVGLWYISEFGIIRLEYAKGEANRIHFAVGESF